MKYRVMFKWPEEPDTAYEYNMLGFEKYVEYSDINKAFADPQYRPFHIKVIEVEE